MKAISDHDTDRRLIQEILSGNKDAFKIIITRYQKLVTHVVFRMVYNQVEREDICQDIFMKIYQNLSNFRFDCKLSTWVAQIAYHTCLNVISRKKNLLMEDYFLPEETWENISGDAPHPDQLAENNERQRHLNREIAHLPIQYRAILTLFHLEQMSYQQIAEIMDLPEGTVKSYLHRARQTLKEKLLIKYQLQEI